MSKSFELSVADVCDDIEAMNPHLGLLIPMLKRFILLESSIRKDATSESMNDDEVWNEAYAFFTSARHHTNSLLLARARYSFSVKELSLCQRTPGFTRLDRKAIRLGCLPFEKALKAEFTSALRRAEEDRVLRNAMWREVHQRAREARTES